MTHVFHSQHMVVFIDVSLEFQMPIRIILTPNAHSPIVMSSRLTNVKRCTLMSQIPSKSIQHLKYPT